MKKPAAPDNITTFSVRLKFEDSVRIVYFVENAVSVIQLLPVLCVWSFQLVVLTFLSIEI